MEQSVVILGNYGEVVEKAIVLSKELKHEDGAESRSVLFEADDNGTVRFFGMKYLYVFEAPTLIIVEVGGGASICCTEEFEEEIEDTVRHFFELHTLEFIGFV